MGKITDFVDDYILELENIKYEVNMSDSWREKEAEQARRNLVKSIKVSFEDSITKVCVSGYDSRLAGDAVDEVEDALLKELWEVL